MTTVDYIIVAALLLSTSIGAIRGFLRESVVLLGWLVGLWLAWRYADRVEPFLGGTMRDTLLQPWVARTLVLLAVVVAAWLLGSLLSYIVLRSGLTLGMDRLLGALFGAVRGAVILGFAVMLGQAAELQGEPWWKASRLMPLGQEMATVLRGYVDSGNQYMQEAAPES